MTKQTIRFLLLLCLVSTASAKPVAVPANIDHTPWDRLLQKHVNPVGLVDYRNWSKSPEDLKTLRDYLLQYAPRSKQKAEGDDEVASLINAYNAFMVQYVLNHFPIESIRLLDDEFKGRRYRIGGTLVSAEDIELDMLRSRIGWKMHSVVVCAARSCPPLLNRAYFAEDWDAKVKERYTAWLGRKDLNSYDSKKKRAEISKIFDWHEVDFEGADKPSIRDTLRRYGPRAQQDLLIQDNFRIRFKGYHWGLNAQSSIGRNYKHSWLDSVF